MFKTMLKAASRFMAKANDNDALIPEVWSREALLTLMSNTVFGQLVRRDFSNQIAAAGDIVNTSRPANFTGKRKTDADNVTTQDAVSSNIPVPLNQHLHVSFVIKDGELSKALPDLLERYMEPAARELAEKFDQIIAGQVARLQTYQVGQPGNVDDVNVENYILDAAEQLDDNRAPKFGRWLVMSSRFNRSALGAAIVVEADKRGDAGTALREASVGRIYAFDTFMDQNVATVALGDCETATGTTDNIEAEGSTVVETDITDTADIKAGCYVVIDGSEWAHRVSSKANDPVDLTLTEGVTAQVAASADVTVFLACDVNGNYTTDSAKAGYIVVDGFAANKGPQKGQVVTFGTGASSHSYTVIDVIENSTTEYQILLDRPLDANLSDGDACFPGTHGSRSVAFTRDALAVVIRPLATVSPDMGARSFVTNFDNLSMRVTMQYESESQGYRVTFDFLCGVAVLDERLAVVING